MCVEWRAQCNLLLQSRGAPGVLSEARHANDRVVRFLDIGTVAIKHANGRFQLYLGGQVTHDSRLESGCLLV